MVDPPGWVNAVLDETGTLSNMLAWHLNESPGVYRWGEVPTPTPGPGEVRVRVVATALNHMDLWLTRGMPKPRSFPHVPGDDIAGVVTDVGDGVDRWAAGDEVVIAPSIMSAEFHERRGVDAVLDPNMQIIGEHCWGGHGEFVVVPELNVFRRPANLSWHDSAAFPVVMLTAWRMFRRARLQASDTVLVTGIGGGVATAALLMAKHFGCHVAVTSRDPDKLTRAIALGADETFDSSEVRWPFKADVVVDSVGTATWEAAFSALRPGGRMVICGATSGIDVPLNLPKLFFKQAEVIGATTGSYVEFATVCEMMEAGHPVVTDEVFPLADYPAALDRLKEGRQLGKIVLDHTA